MSHQKLNVITVMLVLILFGTVCTCYAIDCMDLWDDEAVAEMIEDDKRYEEKRKARELGEDVDENVYDDADDDDDDDEDHESDDEDALADHGDGYAGDDGEEEQHHDEAHEPSKSHTETRHKRQLTLSAAEQQQQRQASVPDPSTDLEVAETHLFRPVFRYKSQYTERRRVRDNLTPSRQ